MLIFTSEIFLFLIIVMIWSLLSLLAKYLKWADKGIIIYPLVIVFKSERFKRFITNEAKRRSKFWTLYTKLSPYILFVTILISIAYFITNLSFLLKRQLVITSSGVPLGAELVPIIPFITVTGKLLIFIIIASAVAVIPHEVAHGVVAVRNDIEIKSAGVFCFAGAIIGGFVELPEDVYERILWDGNYQSDVSEKMPVDLKKLKYAISAGVSANVLLLLIFFGLLANYSIIMSPFFNQDGILIIDVIKDGPAYDAGLRPGTIIYEVNGTRIKNVSDFMHILSNAEPQDVLVMKTNRGIYVIELGRNPSEPNKPYLGIFFTTYYRPKIKGVPDFIYYDLLSLIYVIYLIQLIVIFMNALPIFISDGARFLLIVLKEKLTNQNLISKIYFTVNSMCLIILSLNLIVSLIS